MQDWANTDLGEWVKRHPGQAILTVVSPLVADQSVGYFASCLGELRMWLGTVYFLCCQSQIVQNDEVLRCLKDQDPLSRLRVMWSKKVEGLKWLVNLVTSSLVVHQRMAINALLTVEVHHRDTVNSLLQNKVTSDDDFEWTRYWPLTTFLCSVRLVVGVWGGEEGWLCD